MKKQCTTLEEIKSLTNQVRLRTPSLDEKLVFRQHFFKSQPHRTGRGIFLPSNFSLRGNLNDPCIQWSCVKLWWDWMEAELRPL